MPRSLWDRDVVSGCIFIVLGTAAVWYVQRYPMGTLSDMGPGYFPFILSALLLAFGVATLAGALLTREHSPIPAVARRPLVAVTGSVFAFVLLLDRLGLPFAVFVASLIASGARPGFLRPANFLLAAVLAVFSVLLFVRLLGIPMRVLPPALQGY